MTDAAPAATLVLVRNAVQGFEILMIERARTMGFAGGAMVFPGGKVDETDLDIAADPALADGFSRLESADAAARVAAIRETFEEVGVLLTCGPAIDEDTRTSWRPRIARREASFAEFLRISGHRIDAEDLTPFAHWCPPIDFPHNRRFDTRFYITEMPEGEVALHDGDESTTSQWLSPTEALARADAGLGTLVFPTRRNVERLATHDTLERLIAASQAQPVQRIQPHIEVRDGQPWLCIPEGAGYPVTAEALDAAFRG